MNKCLLIIIALILLVSGTARAQQSLSGYIRHLDKDEMVPYVDISNTSNGLHTQADSRGAFSIPAAPGDRIQISRLGIRPVVITVTRSMFAEKQRIYVEYTTGMLDEVDVNGLTIYQQDSLRRDSLYRPTLARKKEKLKVYLSPIGIGIERPFSSWMQYVAPKTKRKLKFKKNFAKWEAEQFIATVYTKELVGAVTGLIGDECSYFMNAYPMTLEMARRSKSLELKAWIRANYTDWVAKGKRVLIK